MIGHETLRAIEMDVFCETCGEWINTGPDIFGDDSREGVRVDGEWICSHCAAVREELEAGCGS